MGLFDFVKDAGSKLFGLDDDKEKAAEATQRSLEAARADRMKSEALERLVRDFDIEVRDLDVAFREGRAKVRGKVASEADREKVVLLLGNNRGVAQVEDDLVVDVPAPSATMYTVQAGDSLSKIAKAHYGDAMKYPVIFEANRPMLKDPDKIYPGQVLRIPPTAD